MSLVICAVDRCAGGTKATCPNRSSLCCPGMTCPIDRATLTTSCSTATAGNCSLPFLTLDGAAPTIGQSREVSGPTPARGTLCRGIWRSMIRFSTSPLGSGVWGSILSEILAAPRGCYRRRRRSCLEGSLWRGQCSRPHSCHRCSIWCGAGGTGCL